MTSFEYYDYDYYNKKRINIKIYVEWFYREYDDDDDDYYYYFLLLTMTVFTSAIVHVGSMSITNFSPFNVFTVSCMIVK